MEAQQATSPENLTITTRSELVLVPVVVTDKAGTHVAGLRKEAFTLEDNKTAREIAVFEEVREAGAAEKGVQEEAGFVANYAPADPQSRRMVIVVLDLVNTPFLRQSTAKTALMKFLTTSLPADEPVALFVLGGNGLKQVHSFTTDTRALIAALRKVSGQISVADTTAEGPSAPNSATVPGSDEAEAEASVLDQTFADSEALATAHVQRNAIRLTLAALEQIAGAFAGIPGRKSVVWATGGFPFTIDDPNAFGRMGTDMVEAYESTWRALNDANIAAYPVDVNGLSAPDMGPSIGEMLPSGARAPIKGGIARSRPMPYDRHREQVETLLAFAHATGGKAFIERNDIENGFRDAVRDSRSYYLLGFYLNGDKKPGWHKLKASVKAPGVHVRAREGFYAGASAEDKQSAERNRKDELFTALASPVDYTGVHFGVKVVAVTKQRYEVLDPAAGAVKTPPEKQTVSYKLMIPKGSVVVDAAQNNAVDFVISVVSVSKDGRATGEFTSTVKTNLTGEALTLALTRGIATNDRVTVPMDTTELRFVIRDNQSGRIGTLHVSTETAGQR